MRRSYTCILENGLYNLKNRSNDETISDIVFSNKTFDEVINYSQRSQKFLIRCWHKLLQPKTHRIL